MTERAWFAVECGMHKHEKMAGLSSDMARLGWYAVLAEAKLQKRQGHFASEAHFRAVVGRYARFLKEYVAAHLLDAEADGGLSVHDWRRHQWAAKKAGQREDNAGTSGGQTEDPHAGADALSLSFVDVSTGEYGGLGEEGEPEAPLLQWLAQHGCYVRPGNGYHVRLVTGVERHGAPAILAMFGKLARAGVIDGDTKGFVFGALDALNPRPDLKALAAEDSEAQTKADFDKRVARTAAYIRDLKGEPA